MRPVVEMWAGYPHRFVEMWISRGRTPSGSRGGDRRAEETGFGDDSLSFAANINVGQRHRLGGARETPPRSGNAPNNGAFPSSQAAKSPPRRGKAVWSAARFVCRMTLYTCRSSSHKTRHAIFAGALKLSHKAFAAQNLCGSPESQESTCSPLTQGRLK